MAWQQSTRASGLPAGPLPALEVGDITGAVFQTIPHMVAQQAETLGDRLIRLAYIPLIGGISYELVKLSGKPRWRPWLAFLIYPGLGLQLMTTKEPDLDMCEVALTSLGACLDPEEARERIPGWGEEKNEEPEEPVK